MNNKSYYVLLEVAAGWIALSGSNTGISRATLPQISKERAFIALGKHVANSVYSESYFESIIHEYLDYFAGKKVEFSDNLDLENHTRFERNVWEATRNITYGETTTYAEIARQIGKPLAARAVGQALGKNPLSIVIPCHRIIASNGKLGGFGGGLEMKRYLLELEAACRS